MKPVISVIGPGRSGTSLIMQILERLGMAISQEMLPAGAGNEKGYYEDLDILKAHKTLLEDLGITKGWVLMPNGWQQSAITRTTADKLRELARDRLAMAGDKTWGFKDPRTTSLLPLWDEIFSSLNVAPRYIMSMRHPASVIRSLGKAANLPPEEAQMLWLLRTCQCLTHTGGEIYVIHFEDLISSGLEKYPDLPKLIAADQGQQMADLSDITDPSMCHHNKDNGFELAPEVADLYRLLRDCAGYGGDRTELMQRVSSFMGYLALMQPLSNLLKDRHRFINTLSAKLDITSKKLEESLAAHEETKNTTVPLDEHMKVVHRLHLQRHSATSKIGELMVNLYHNPLRIVIIPFDFIRVIKIHRLMRRLQPHELEDYNALCKHEAALAKKGKRLSARWKYIKVFFKRCIYRWG